MLKRYELICAGVVFLSASAALAHEDADKLPAGPIRDRHVLMEGIGKQAKIIGGALKEGKLDPVGPAAASIAADAAKALPLFPPGSTHEFSRAKPEIWTHWEDFQKDMKSLQTDATALAAAAKSGGDVPGAAQKMFGNCKGCHEEYRVPDKKP